MRIVCPSCQAAYEVPDDRLAPGRPVKCARCAHLWPPIPLPPPSEPEAPQPGALPPATPSLPESPPTSSNPVEAPTPKPAGPELLEPLPFEPPPALIAPPPATPARRPSPLPLAAAWALTLILVAGLAYGAIARRADIIQAWPPSARAYAALGLLPPPH